jgi:signal transduction histidine kinase
MWCFHSSSAHTAALSRREVVEHLRKFAPDAENFFDVELIVGELLANTVQHAPGMVEIRIEWTGEYPVLHVRDTGPGMDHVDGKLPEEAFSESGRGIFLVRQLARDISVKSGPGQGTELRVVLPIRRS